MYIVPDPGESRRVKLPVLLVSNAVSTFEIEEVISCTYGIYLVGTSTIDRAAENIRKYAPILVWIDLTKDPNKALYLLNQITGDYESTQCIVSCKPKDIALIKKAYKLGACEVLTDDRWKEDLPASLLSIKLGRQASHMDFSPE